MHVDPGTDSPPPLDAAALRHALVEGPHAPYTSLEVVDEIGSTNAEQIKRAGLGAADRSVLLAEFQASGRGRLGRSWTAPPRTQVALSVLLRPGAVSPTLFGWLPLVTGLAVRDGLVAAGGVDATLKWPNDVLVDGRKISGILAEMTSVPAGGDFGVRLPALVVGVGINVSLTRAQLPVPHATSLALLGGVTDRDAVARAVLEALAARHAQWRACERGSGSSISDELLEEYSRGCSTLGAEVSVELPGDVVRTGRAERVDRSGRLVVVTPDGELPVTAGDITHIRPAGDRWGG
ncbi:biotin--[acetyl-CoA-carboxylase] ligase [Rhodococcus sp. IEGM 1408]|uniref:biotin--[acetyl-CoA-carboxylase] ligase n=1 Tax=Rhodococcus sp. IEGM 1408 TaxID=3082220 RepID=UPI00295594C8|nr:biotin--[acetyl-CoA-carboxylase] ligase [Rhodococcus sp. IEGM 1408]MDV8000900.1 biotin--[acetyl-CoA-carboxylase] ligase [Rhodococcus sp. IEGM 1408]